MAEKKSDAPAEAEQPTSVPHYRIVGAGVTGAGGVAFYAGDIVTVEQLGGPERVAALLARVRNPGTPEERRPIEAVDD